MNEIEELAFKKRKELANLNELNLLEIIEFLQLDRKQWINQFTQTHNGSIEIQKENKQLKDNWIKLKEYIYNQIPTDKTVLTKHIKIFEVLDKMQKLEGNDSNGNN